MRRRPQWQGEQDINRNRNLGFDEANAAPLKILGNFPHQLLREKIELGAEALGLQLPQQRLVLLGEVKGHGGEVPGQALKLADLLRSCARVVLGNLDQSLGQTDGEEALGSPLACLW
jgi:hypothetical protein